MKSIELTRGQVTVVDDADLGFLSQWRWVANLSSGRWYAVRYERNKAILMHRVLLAVGAGVEVDHQNGDGLDNRRSNIRRCTRTQNQQNRRKFVFKTKPSSQFKGVYYEAKQSDGRLRAKPWCAQLVSGRKKIRRYHVDEESAARAYDVLAELHFGEFAVLNFAEAA